MDSADQQAYDVPNERVVSRRQHLRARVERAGARTQPLLAFWTKVNDDWIFNLSGLLAYNFLMSLFPIVLILLACFGFVLGGQEAAMLTTMQRAIEHMVPGGGVVFEAVSTQLASSAGALLLIGLFMSLFAGSRLFVVLENCFGIIFRVRGRDFIPQNLMAFGMLALYVILGAVIMLAWTMPSAVIRIRDPTLQAPALDALVLALSYLIALLAALALVCAMYIVVPNRHVSVREMLPGAAVATLLLALYQLLFPAVVGYFLRPETYGAVAAFAIVNLLFYYYLAFILLLGAEINAWIAGLRKSSGDIAAVMHASDA